MVASWAGPVAPAGGQDLPAVTRAEAIQAALAGAPRLQIARADTALAYAQLLGARAFPNPSVSAGYSKAVPRYHGTLELPLEYPWVRAARVASGGAAREAAGYRYRLERAAVELEADTTYTRALAARERARLSRRNAQAADSLRRIVIARRDAGDASDLDVLLAEVSAGREANLAAADSLALLSVLLDLQAVMGMSADEVRITLADSLDRPPEDSIPRPPRFLAVAAAEASLESARLAARAQRSSVVPPPSLSVGVESGDPTGAEPGLLPTVGLILPLPLLNRNRGPIAQAEAQRDRAQAELALVRLESRLELARAERTRSIALARIARDRALLASANRVAAMALTAYRDGASPLPAVLEAQRSARESLAQYVDDLASAWIATAKLRTLTAADSLGGAR